MRVQTFDLATTTGWAKGDPYQGPPQWGEHTFLSKPGPNAGLLFASAHRWFWAQISGYGPDVVMYEEPLTTIHNKKSTLATKFKLVGLGVVLELVCHEHGVPCEWVNNSELKKWFVGYGGFSKKTEPYPPLETCWQLGWTPRTDNEADALALWAFAVWCKDRHVGEQFSPLFRS